MRGLVRGAFVGLLTTIGALAPVATAGANLTCSYDATGVRPTVRVLLTGNSGMRLEVVGADVQVQDLGGVPIACDGGVPTTTTTDAIRIAAEGKKGNSVTIETPSAYAPGVEDEGPVEPDEIEVRVDLGRGRDALALVGDDIGEQITIGADGINTNAADTVAPDVDLVPRRLEGVKMLGRDGNDELSGGGGAGTGPAYSRRIELDGENGADSVVGGAADDRLAGGVDNDELRGGRGNDLLIGAPGDDDLFGGPEADRLNGSADGDLLDGGGGIDAAEYGSFNGPTVTVDIGVGGANDGGTFDGPEGDRDEVLATVENLTGDEEADVFTGDQGRNVLLGRAGADSLFGLGGGDRLKAKDGEADAVIDCGPGRDEVRLDLGLDPAPVSC